MDTTCTAPVATSFQRTSHFSDSSPSQYLQRRYPGVTAQQGEQPGRRQRHSFNAGPTAPSVNHVSRSASPFMLNTSTSFNALPAEPFRIPEVGVREKAENENNTVRRKKGRDADGRSDNDLPAAALRRLALTAIAELRCRGNPGTQGGGYRFTVLNLLPQLQLLDGSQVTESAWARLQLLFTESR